MFAPLDKTDNSKSLHHTLLIGGESRLAPIRLRKRHPAHPEQVRASGPARLPLLLSTIILSDFSLALKKIGDDFQFAPESINVRSETGVVHVSLLFQLGTRGLVNLQYPRPTQLVQRRLAKHL